MYVDTQFFRFLDQPAQQCIIGNVPARRGDVTIHIVCSCSTGILAFSLRWRHNGRDSVSNHQPHHCLPNRLFRPRSKKTLKLRITGLCVGNSPGTGEFPAQMASNAENVSIWWRHHVQRLLSHTICRRDIWSWYSYGGSKTFVRFTLFTNVIP